MVARSASPHQPVVDWLAAPQTRTPLTLGCGGWPLAVPPGWEAVALYQSSFDRDMRAGSNWPVPVRMYQGPSQIYSMYTDTHI